jgi:hypothetical protein
VSVTTRQIVDARREPGVRALTAAGLDKDEAEDVLARESNRGTVRSTNVVATDYLHLVHPDTGLDVVFVPGEAIPQWAWLAVLQGQQKAQQKLLSPRARSIARAQADPEPDAA